MRSRVALSQLCSHASANVRRTWGTCEFSAAAWHDELCAFRSGSVTACAGTCTDELLSQPGWVAAPVCSLQQQTSAPLVVK